MKKNFNDEVQKKKKEIKKLTNLNMANLFTKIP